MMISLVLAVAALAATGAPVAAPARTTPPRSPLSVTMTSDRDELGYGDAVTYQITVHDSGTSAFDAAMLTQLLPPTLAFRSGTGHPQQTSYEVHWTVAVAPGKDATVSMTAAVVHATARDAAGSATARKTLSTTACVAPARASQLVACNTDFDAFSAVASSAPETKNMPRLLPAAGVGLAVVLVAVSGFLFRRRRRLAASGWDG